MLRLRDHVFQIKPSFNKDDMNMSFHGNQIEASSNITAKNVLLAFQMKQNGMFLENFEYDHKVLHKNLHYFSLNCSYISP